MKSFIYVTLLLIALSFCDDCSSKAKDKCTGSCKWTDGAAATCAKKTDCAHTGTGDAITCSDTTNCVANGGKTACESIADTCTLKADNTACASKEAAAATTGGISSSMSVDVTVAVSRESYIRYSMVLLLSLLVL